MGGRVAAYLLLSLAFFSPCMSQPLPDGIYLDYKDVLRSTPAIPKHCLVPLQKKEDPAWYKKVVAANVFHYVDDKSEPQKIKKADIWGYSIDGVFYYKDLGPTSSGFQRAAVMRRLEIVGRISLFTVFSMRTHLSAASANRKAIHGRSSYFLIDLESGQQMPMTQENLTRLLSRDEAILEQYESKMKAMQESISQENGANRSQKAKANHKLMVRYIKTYNKYNPLF